NALLRVRRNLDRCTLLQLLQDPLVLPLPGLVLQLISNRSLGFIVERLQTRIITLDQTNDMEAISQWHHEHVVLTHLKKNRFRLGRLDFAASMAITLAVEIGTIPLVVFG